MTSIVKEVKAKGGKVISGKDAARLYQSGGFPFDLTRLMAEEEGLTVDEDAFEKQQEVHREASKGTGSGGSSATKIVLKLLKPASWRKIRKLYRLMILLNTVMFHPKLMA